MFKIWLDSINPPPEGETWCWVTTIEALEGIKPCGYSEVLIDFHYDDMGGNVRLSLAVVKATKGVGRVTTQCHV